MSDKVNYCMMTIPAFDPVKLVTSLVISKARSTVCSNDDGILLLLTISAFFS